jgi:hypothetical protein
MALIYQIGIVSQSSQITSRHIALVSAAIQKQITRDLRPVWGIDATVDCFASLEDVPLGYWSVIVRDNLPYEVSGIHLNHCNRQPFALICCSPNWSLTVSHECLEMLVNPCGNRVVAGNSVAGAQRRVEYMVEIADPCEHVKFSYSINGVLVSDFYTPDFFDPVTSPQIRYSFRGSITAPRQVLDGGYLSWRDPETNHIWQLLVNGTEQQILDRGPLPDDFTSLRGFSNRYSVKHRMSAIEDHELSDSLLLTSNLGPGGDNKPSAIDKASSANAESLQRQIDEFIGNR